MSDEKHTVGRIEQLTHYVGIVGEKIPETTMTTAGGPEMLFIKASASEFPPPATPDAGTPTHLVTDDAAGQILVDAGHVRKVGTQTYEILDGSPDAGACTCDQLPPSAPPSVCPFCVGRAIDVLYGKKPDAGALVELQRLPMEGIVLVNGQTLPDGKTLATFKDWEDYVAKILARHGDATEARVRAEVWKRAHAATALHVRTVVLDAREEALDVIKQAALADGVDLTSSLTENQ